MIRLIASDLDGTLLGHGSTLPDGLFETIENLHKKGILFVAASGRQWAKMLRMFAPVLPIIGLVNGTVVSLGDKILKTFEIENTLANELIQAIAKQNLHILVSGAHSCYILKEDREFSDRIIYLAGNTTTVVSDFSEITEPITKISACSDGFITPYVKDFKRAFEARLHSDKAGDKWMDFTPSNKANGLRILFDIYDISPNDVMAFGDNGNDVEMLSLVGHPYLMDHADISLRREGLSLLSPDEILPLMQRIAFNS